MISVFCCAAGLAAAFIAMKRTFLNLWIIIFSVLVSIYLSVTLTASAAKALPSEFGTQMVKAGVVFLLGVLLFLIINLLTGVFFNKRFSIAFPKKFTLVVKPVLGFLIGYITAGAILFLVQVSPVSQIGALGGVFNESFEGGTKRIVARCCKTVDFFSLQRNDDEISKVIDWFCDRGGEENVEEQIDSAEGV